MTYEYVCEACGHQWEAEQSIKDSPLKKCVSCGVEKAKRLISGGTGFLLKGGGWYADLYGSPGSGSKSADDKGGKTPASAKPDAAKPDAKPDAAKPDAGSKSDGGSSGDSKPTASSTASTPSASSSSSSAAS